ncbi:MAG TPA: tRNA (N6-threonylcarbamoyladenosine(37)-N6)-methyltransferase TrmO [Oscillospiraceae bacterium]|nr:tRNA (N6-threonylcarbamoyladenosine(37)-N6)-methyltransferase TrmO [Oscillospiraceae bacterium]HPF54985.1 tRNA (N6-threonylcarbamoyladenosine(37)-N6)-methyltransferase TrmO [Clostridiales bacterium]HPK34398.1 tRNA (N6-threonylcarbamoyladenosine(37)-N6)-methyltransferase TrmO [Oscillospiraceae bacterium]HPR76728.1 tRNA (N6-threonylcarbamoyladenosine(37)-N6)-methyltransferase TrmO [Oscillospiraceae bacterium]
MFTPIGTVKCPVTEKVDYNWGTVISEIILAPEYEKGLTGLAEFNHAIIVFHLNEAKYIPEKHLVRRPQGREDMPMVGIFAQRAKDRPNPIGITAVEIIAVSGNILTVKGLDAIDGTPVLDIKPYYPQYDKKDASTPKWVETLMETYF